MTDAVSGVAGLGRSDAFWGHRGRVVLAGEGGAGVAVVPVLRWQDRFVARYHAEVLRATFSVEFEDTLMGGVALHGFAEMLLLKYGFRHVGLVSEDQTLRFRSKAVVQALLTGSVETTPLVESLAG